MSHLAKLFALFAGLLLAPVAHAHVGPHEAGLLAGVWHPFSGWDHLLAAIAVGLWSAQLARPAAHGMLAAFVVILTVTAAVGAGSAGTGVEAGIALSLLLSGMLVALRARLPLPFGAVLAGGFAVVQGVAHGAVLPGAASGAYLFGLGFATAVLLLASRVAAASLLARHPLPLQAAGGGIAVVGALLWGGL